MQISSFPSEDAVLEEIGRRLAQQRITLGLTQADLAKQAGVGKRTVERLEAGESTQMGGFLRIVRELELLDSLLEAFPNPGPSPMALLKLKGKVRQRASKSSVVREPAAKWTWGDEA